MSQKSIRGKISAKSNILIIKKRFPCRIGWGPCQTMTTSSAIGQHSAGGKLCYCQLNTKDVETGKVTRGSERGGKAWVWWWMSRLLWDYDWWREKNCWYDGENEGSQTRSCSGGIKMFYLRRWKKFSVGRIMSLKLEMKDLVLQVVGAYTPQVGYQLEKEECWSNSNRITPLDITLLMSLTYKQQSENQQPLCFF